jgi:CubicO group peptidase (beta-lactamase class C family)
MSYKVSAICMKVMIVSCFMLILQPLFAQYNFSDLDAMLERNKKQLGNNVVTMIWKDTMIHKKEIGEFNSKTAAPIGSASKWFTAALAMIFIDEGKISIDDKITKWLPEYAKYGKNYITIRYCLSNFIGIRQDEKFLQKMFDRKKFASLEDEVNSYAAREIQTNPGTEFRFSDFGFNIVGRILEIVSKRRFDVLIRQKLFVPLAMRKTSFTDINGGPIDPASGAQSSGDDYIKFLALLLNKGKFGGKQIISEQSINQLFEIQTTPDKIKFTPKVTVGENYALGSWVLDYDANGKGTAFSCPGFNGTWAVVDYCRGYAYFVLPKATNDDDKYIGNKPVKDEIDPQISTANCK